MKFLGPKMTLYCTLVSIWGVIQLTILAVCFYIQCVGLYEDINKQYVEKEKHEHISPEEFYERMDKGYMNTFWNCVVAIIIYATTLVLLTIQSLTRRKKSQMIRREKEQQEYEKYIEQMIEEYVHR